MARIVKDFLMPRGGVGEGFSSGLCVRETFTKDALAVQFQGIPDKLLFKHTARGGALGSAALGSGFWGSGSGSPRLWAVRLWLSGTLCVAWSFWSLKKLWGSDGALQLWALQLWGTAPTSCRGLWGGLAGCALRCKIALQALATGGATQKL